MKHSAVIGALLMVAGCASSPKGPPDWLEEPSAKYPEARFLVGQGQADLASVARDRARADLVKVFEARISEASQDSSTARRDSTGGKVKQSSGFKAERHVNVTTAYAVEGIRVPEVWYDGKRKSYHALAVLDRLQASERLRGEIMHLDDLTGREMQNAKNASELFAQMNFAAKALGAQRRRDRLQRELRVVDPTGVGIPVRFDSDRLDSDLNQLTKRLRLIPEVERDPVGNLESILAGAIGRSGFSPAAKGDPKAYRLVCTLSLAETHSGGWYWARGVLQVKVVDTDNNVRSSQQWSIKESAQQPGVASQRAMGEVDRVLRHKLRGAVLGGTSE
jgi:hypothetical protein